MTALLYTVIATSFSASQDQFLQTNGIGRGGLFLPETALISSLFYIGLSAYGRRLQYRGLPNVTELIVVLNETFTG